MSIPIARARRDYANKGYAVFAEPVLPAANVTAAANGMQRIREGSYDRGRPPEASPWNPGDDPRTLCQGLSEFVDHLDLCPIIHGEKIPDAFA